MGLDPRPELGEDSVREEPLYAKFPGLQSKQEHERLQLLLPTLQPQGKLLRMLALSSRHG